MLPVLFSSLDFFRLPQQCYGLDSNEAITLLCDGHRYAPLLVSEHKKLTQPGHIVDVKFVEDAFDLCPDGLW